MATGDTLIDKIERLLFGATAEERVNMMTRIAEQRLEQRIIAALEADEGDDDGDTERQAAQERRSAT